MDVLVYYVQNLHRHVPELRGPNSRAGDEPKVSGKSYGRRETAEQWIRSLVEPTLLVTFS